MITGTNLVLVNKRDHYNNLGLDKALKEKREVFVDWSLRYAPL